MTTVGPVPVRPLLETFHDESAPTEDGEGGEDESMQEGGRGREESPTSPRARKCRST